jgi:hypothetical protein
MIVTMIPPVGQPVPGCLMMKAISTSLGKKYAGYAQAPVYSVWSVIGEMVLLTAVMFVPLKPGDVVLPQGGAKATC